MKRKLPRGVVPAMVVLGLVLLAVLGYFVLISPQRSKAARLDDEIAIARTTIAFNRALSRRAARRQPIRVADLFRLTKAIPDQADMSGLILELSRMASETGVTFESIAPRTPVARFGFKVLPISVVLGGNFYGLSDFLYRLRHQVRVRDGKLDATGRLLVVETIDLGEGSSKFPDIQALLTVDAFVYEGGAPTGTPSPPVPPAVSEPPAEALQGEVTAAGATP